MRCLPASRENGIRGMDSNTNTTTRQCMYCMKWLPVDDFPEDLSKHDKLSWLCYECHDKRERYDRRQYYLQTYYARTKGFDVERGLEQVRQLDKQVRQMGNDMQGLRDIWEIWEREDKRRKEQGKQSDDESDERGGGKG